MEPYEIEIAQDEREIAAFADLLVREGVARYLEIGSKFGGSLWRIGKALPAGSLIVSVDKPNGTRLWSESQISLASCVNRLNIMGQNASVIWGDSAAPETIAAAGRQGPFDAVFIDADHRLPGLTLDWTNYGKMGRIVAFHDIAWHRAPEWKGVRIDVPAFWASIKGDFRHEEFRFCPTRKNNGIGVLWRA